MRKVSLLIVAFLFTAGMAFAQNTSDVDQTGHNNEADITQSGNNHVNVEQIQTGGSGNSGMSAVVDQTGSNFGDIFQQAVRQSRALLIQDGTDNDAFIEQWDYANDAEVRQIDGAERNWARIYQANGRFALGDILQTGDDNIAEIEQYRTEASAVTRARGFITQSGSDNDAYIRQDLQQRARAEIIQESNWNIADIHQEGSVAIHTNHQALITQRGDDGNESYLFQTGGSANDMQHDATILQDGADNYVDMEQRGDNQFVDIQQFGDENQVVGLGGSGAALQEGANHELYVTQHVGSFQNITEVHQFGVGTNVINVNQDGSDNFATIVQGN